MAVSAPPATFTVAPAAGSGWEAIAATAPCYIHGRSGYPERFGAFFGDDDLPADVDMLDARREPASLPATASEGIAFLDLAYRRWHDGIAALDDAGLRRPLGPKGGEYATDSMAGLILHISREVVHHGGEICLLRDLYRARG